MQARPKAVLKGVLSRMPILNRLACRTSGGTVSARYCYSVWLRHLVKGYESGLIGGRLNRVAELGPGDSFGVGLGSLLSGADEYYALDGVRMASVQTNLKVLDELVQLFERREPIPAEAEFPEVLPRLNNYLFPGDILPEPLLKAALAPRRIDELRAALRGEVGGRIRIHYIAPWTNSHQAPDGVVDMAFSQAVLEHVDDVPGTYAALRRWLRPGGFMSHTIDFRSHQTTRDWYGHWTLGDWGWQLIRGNLVYLLNRWPHSGHVSAMEKTGFRVAAAAKCNASPAPRDALSSRFKWLTDEDLSTSSVFIQAVKPER